LFKRHSMFERTSRDSAKPVVTLVLTRPVKRNADGASQGTQRQVLAHEAPSVPFAGPSSHDSPNGTSTIPSPQKGPSRQPKVQPPYGDAPGRPASQASPNSGCTVPSPQ
jgi:hypothetical protein